MMPVSRWKQNGWVDAEVRRLDPFSETLDVAELDSALSEAGRRILRSVSEEQALQRSRRRLRTPRRLVVVGVLVLGTSGAAAWASGVFVNANTHTYNHGWQHVAGGPGENITGAGTNFDQVVRTEAAGSGIVFPADYASWRTYEIKFTRHVLCDAGHSHGGHACAQESTGMLNVTLTQDAFCTWVLQWRHAELSGNHAAARQASRVIATVLRWKAATDIKYIAGMFSSSFAWMRPYQVAVAAGDLRKVDAMITSQGTGQNVAGGDWFWFFDPGFTRFMRPLEQRANRTHRAAAFSRAEGSMYKRYLRRHGS